MRAVALALVLAACSSKPSPKRVSSDELVDRNWLDAWPDDKDDHLHVYRFTPSMGGGVFQDRTVFKGTFELFTFEIDGDRLRFVMPHTGERVETRFRIEKVDGPEPFDLRLTLDRSPRGPRVYYGRQAERGLTYGLALDAD